MSSQIRSPGTVVNDSSAGVKPWVNPSNAVSSNDSYATAAMIEEDSNYLKATNFGFAIQSNAIIQGIAVRVERSIASGGDGVVRDEVVSLVVGGSIQGDNKADLATNWTGSDTYIRYPLSLQTDLWGISSLTFSVVNASTFGCVFSAINIGAVSLGRTARVDHVEMTVYYLDVTASVSGSSTRVLFMDSLGRPSPASEKRI